MKILRNLLVICALLSGSAMADLPSIYDLPDTGYATNTMVDIVQSGGAIWFISSRGVNYTFDEGQTWLLYDESNGLVSDNISAIFPIDGRIWLGTNHTEFIDNENVSVSDGLSYTDDEGLTWNQIDFGEGGLDITPPVTGGNRTIFDITGYNDLSSGRDWLFFSAFAAGLLASQDGGMTFRRIYPSPSDSIQFTTQNVPSLRNRYFSSVIDTSHTDSVFLWTGTASGIFQYVYAPKRQKFFGRRVMSLSVCTDCIDTLSKFSFLGTGRGATRGLRTGGRFITRFESDGLSGSSVTFIYAFADRVFAGTADSITGVSTGLAVSDDYGDSYTDAGLTEVVGENRKVVDLTNMDGRLYLAGEQAGLFVSNDTGQTWQQLLYDSVNASSAVNAANAVYPYHDSLLVGTDTGLVFYRLDGTGVILERSLVTFPEDLFSGRKVIRVKVQEFENPDTAGVIDSTSIWTVNRPMTVNGTRMVARSTIINDSMEFANYKLDTAVYDIAFLGDTAFTVGATGIQFSVNGDNPAATFRVVDSVTATNFDDDTIYVMHVMAGDTLFIGSSKGMAVSPDGGETFAVFIGNIDSLGADLAVNYTRATTVNIDSTTGVFGLTGDFIPALGVQYRPDGPARIWASGRPAGSGINGLSVGMYVPVLDTAGDSVGTRLRWRALYGGDFAWNFAFYGDSVFAATNAGVLVNYGDTSEVWDTAQFIDGEGRRLLEPGTATYAVRVVDGQLWVGSDEGTVRMNLANQSDAQLFLYVDSTSPPDEVYAFPTPFSPLRGEVANFHFTVTTPATVTLEIYDFAMNLVSRPIDNVYFPAGIYPNGSFARYTWDGYNGKGDRAAVGMYYFKVEYSTGEVRWGKLAVIP